MHARISAWSGLLLLLMGPLGTMLTYSVAASEEEPKRTVKTVVQTRPGGPLEEVEMPVVEAPVDPLVVAAEQASLQDDDLVLGVVVDGVAMAYPVRYLALYEVINDRVGETALAPSW